MKKIKNLLINLFMWFAGNLFTTRFSIELKKGIIYDMFITDAFLISLFIYYFPIIHKYWISFLAFISILPAFLSFIYLVKYAHKLKPDLRLALSVIGLVFIILTMQSKQKNIVKS